jgi:hypothetical protein
MNLQVMEALGVQKAFVLGTSQGGVRTSFNNLFPDGPIAKPKIL